MACCSKTKIGDLKFNISILKNNIISSDGLGGYNRTWENLGSTRAKIKFSSVKNRITGEVLGAAGEATITVRVSVPIETGNRVELSDGKQYECIGSNPTPPMSDYKEVFVRLVEHEKASV